MDIEHLWDPPGLSFTGCPRVRSSPWEGLGLRDLGSVARLLPCADMCPCRAGPLGQWWMAVTLPERCSGDRRASPVPGLGALHRLRATFPRVCGHWLPCAFLLTQSSIPFPRTLSHPLLSSNQWAWPEGPTSPQNASGAPLQASRVSLRTGPRSGPLTQSPPALP